jgi:hypothetical protein
MQNPDAVAVRTAGYDPRFSHVLHRPRRSDYLMIPGMIAFADLSVLT